MTLCKEDRSNADETFLLNMYILINKGKRWGWLMWLRKRAVQKYYFIVSSFGSGEFRKKQKIKELFKITKNGGESESVWLVWLRKER